MRSIFLTFLGCCLFILFMASPLNVFGQPGDPTPDPDTVPITGIEILIGLGGLMGVKKIRDLTKKKPD